MHFVTIPGIDNSDQAHWQSIWETEWGASASRIDVASWERPELEDWWLAIDRAMRNAGPSAVLVAHSLGCLAATQWAAGNPSASRGLFLVCPPDPLGCPLGHINSASGLGRWGDGRALLTAFTAGLTAPSIPAQP